MSRDINGNYTLPAGNPVVADTLIDINWANPTLDDIATALQDSLSRSGKGSMQAALRAYAGVVAAPGLSWALEPTSGFYRAAAGDIRMALLGTDLLSMTAAGLSLSSGKVLNMVKGADIASAATVDLTAATGNLVHITGTTTITAVTLGSGMMRQVIFDGILTLTHHATNNNLPTAANITTAAGDRALYWSDGTTVYCISYQRATGQPLAASTITTLNVGVGADIASAATVNLTTATGTILHITGTTAITAVTLGAGMVRQVIFDGILTLTHHATNNNLPTAANITTAAGDRALYWSDGTTVYCISYDRANGQPLRVTQAIQFAASDETTALTTGTGKMTFRMPFAFTVTDIRGSLTTAQTSGSIFTVNVKESGTTILSTKLTIDNGEKTSTTAATPPVLSDTSLADDAEITVDIDSLGDGTAKGLKVTLIGYRT